MSINPRINNTDYPKVVFSKPMTMRGDSRLPVGFHQIANESMMTFNLSKKVGYPYCDYLTQIYVVAKLIKNRGSSDVLISGRFGDFFAIYQSLIPWGKKPYILLEPEWMSNHPPGLKKNISVLLHRLISKGAEKIQVICEEEANNYSEYYGIPKEKFVWIPYCTDESESYHGLEEKNYIFSGGRNERDWETLYHAVKDLDIEVRIVAPPQTIEKKFISSNMTLLGKLPRDEYFREMASSKLVVLSLQPNIMRFPGVITYVYSMRMGKCTIVNEPIGAKSYIQDKVTGYLVESSDHLALKNKIEVVLANDKLRKSIGNNAAAHAKDHFSLTNYIDTLSNLSRLLAMD